MTSDYLIGSISSGTMRPEDLIPVFVDTLDELKEARSLTTASDELSAVREFDRLDTYLAEIEQRQKQEGYYESDDAQFDLEWLFDELNAFAPPYFYFGAHPGDGADYGFWLAEGALDDFDGLRVADTSEVPSDYCGEVLHVNDHGNCTLYVADQGQLSEIWAIV